ncbi:MAG: DUF2334 domain-containing protein [Gammaproteobacteria bacterium]|nr:DUF2334 domain-containing protein [Gammaproteobacteria bacterium]
MERSFVGRVSFRLDDPSPTSDHALEAEILRRFQRYGIPLTVAVVPFGKPEPVRTLVLDDVRHIIEARQSGDIEIALHGYRHLQRTRIGGSPSEFSGVPLAEQTDMLRRGRDVLQRIFGEGVTGFVPPWNTFDGNTLKAVAAAGMEYLGAGFGAAPSLRQPAAPRIVPKTCTLNQREYERACNEARRFAHGQPWIVFVFHPDNFVEYRDPSAEGEPAPWLTLSLLETMLEQLRAEPDIVATTLQAAVHADGVHGRLWNPAELLWVGRLVPRAGWRIPTRIVFRRSRLHGLRCLAYRVPGNRD